MDIVLDVASTEQHFEEIVELQKRNLASVLSEEQQAQQGFVTAEHTTSLLKMMSGYLPQVIAVNNGKVIGYSLAMPAVMKNEIPVFLPFFSYLEKIQYNGKPIMQYNFLVGGQVCVDQAFRGRGLLSKLYHELRTRTSGYELCITEVAARNVPSLQSHMKMGFEKIDSYDDGGGVWEVVVWDFSAKKIS